MSKVLEIMPNVPPVNVAVLTARLGGHNVWESGLIDVAAISIVDGEIVGDFHAYIEVDEAHSYRFSTLRSYGLTLGDLEERGQSMSFGCGGVADVLRNASAIWTIERPQVAQRILRDHDVRADQFDPFTLFNALRGAGVHPYRASDESEMWHRLRVSLDGDARDKAAGLAVGVARMLGAIRKFGEVAVK